MSIKLSHRSNTCLQHRQGKRKLESSRRRVSGIRFSDTRNLSVRLRLLQTHRLRVRHARQLRHVDPTDVRGHCVSIIMHNVESQYGIGKPPEKGEAN